MTEQPSVTLSTLIHAMCVIELEAVARDDAIRELVESTDWVERGVRESDVIHAIEEREAAAQTVVAEDLAIPHASLDWDGDYSIVLGRSHLGIDFGAGGTVRLVVLLVTGRNRMKTHLHALSTLADLLKETEFRGTLIEAGSIERVEQLLNDRADGSLSRRKQLPTLSIRLTEQAVELATVLKAQAMLLAVDRLSSVPWVTLQRWPRQLIVVSTSVAPPEAPNRQTMAIYEVPHAGLSRIDRANLGMLLAASNGLITDDSDILCLTGPPGERLDCVAVMRPADKFHAVLRGNTERGTGRIPPAVVLRVISLAIELASEGREGKSIGSMFVVGHSRRVQKFARQLVLNPFHGFSRTMRNVLDPGLAETVKEYAALDGAFIVAADGTMLSAGTYLTPETSSTDLPGGLGARHQAAAGITARTKAMAITVSQSTGTVTIYQNGDSVLSLERSSFTRW